MNGITAAGMIAELGLAPLPNEGGFFRRTWTSATLLGNGRAAGSAILFLVTPDGFSALHRLETDELWHFLGGDPVEHLQLDARDRSVRLTRFGSGAASAQLVVRGGAWQGARLSPEAAPADGEARRGWALFGCTLVPAWDEKEFTLGRRGELVRLFPGQAERIVALTR